MLAVSVMRAAYADNGLALQLQQLNNLQLRTTDNLWQRMRAGFILNHQQSKEVQYWEKRYSNPKYFNIIMQNAAPYLYFVLSELERRGMPAELALIPIVESTYNPNAVSPAAISTGMWQFLASSGKRFGMTVNSDLDERKDIIKSTRGAIAYLQYLHDLFASWELAIAAYNWGEGNINNALNNTASRNFYDLDVRDVTHQYVPKVIALASIIENPGKFGITLTQLPNQPYFAVIKPPQAVTLRDFLSQSRLDETVNKKLNPQYSSSDYLVQPTQRLLLPLHEQAIYLSSIGMPLTAVSAQSTDIVTGNLTPEDPAIPDSNINDAITQLAQGIPGSIANNTQQQGTPSNTANSTHDAVNDLLASSAMATKPEEPSAKAAATHPVNKPPVPASEKQHISYFSYIVVSGDTLYSIAKRFTLSLAVIRADNQLTGNTVRLKQKLLIRSSS